MELLGAKSEATAEFEGRLPPQVSYFLDNGGDARMSTFFIRLLA